MSDINTLNEQKLFRLNKKDNGGVVPTFNFIQKGAKIN